MNTTQLHPYIVPQERLEGAPIEDSIGFHTRAIIGQGDDHMALQDNVVEIAIVLLTSDIDRPAIRRRQLIAIAPKAATITTAAMILPIRAPLRRAARCRCCWRRCCSSWRRSCF